MHITLNKHSKLCMTTLECSTLNINTLNSIGLHQHAWFRYGYLCIGNTLLQAIVIF